MSIITIRARKPVRKTYVEFRKESKTGYNDLKHRK